jgi:hypothetical protein
MRASPVDTKQAAERLRRAIESGDFQSAPALAEEYVETVRREIEITPARERAALAEQACSFLEDRLHLARVMRAHIASELRVASGVASYQNAGPAGNTWEIQG